MKFKRWFVQSLRNFLTWEGLESSRKGGLINEPCFRKDSISQIIFQIS